MLSILSHTGGDMFEKMPFVEGFALQKYLPAEVGIAEAKDNGYQYWYIDGSLTGEEVTKWNVSRIDAMKELINLHEVKPIFHGNFKAPLASEVTFLRKAAVEYAKMEIDLAGKLGAPLILHAGAVVEPRLVALIKKRALEGYYESLQELNDYAQKCNVEIYLENLANYRHYRPFHYIFTTTDEINYILTKTGLKLFLDLGHAYIGDGDPVGLIKKFHKSIAGMSFSNNNGQTDQHLGLCSGEIDYKEVISAILDSNWKGIIGFETRDKSPKESISELQTIYKGMKN